MSRPDALQSALARAFAVAADADGGALIDTHFVFADGDQPVICARPQGDGWELNDRGTTMMRLSWQLNDAEWANPENRKRLESALKMGGVTRNEKDELVKVVSPDNCADDFCRFLHAMLRIDELGDYPATRPPTPS